MTNRPLTVALLWLILTTQSGCMLTYLVQSGNEQLKILSRREPIEKALESPETPEATKQKLRLAIEAREFTQKQLGFKLTENYKTYVDLKRPYVTWVVTASPKDDIESYMWPYPFVGKMPYKGFFSKEGALEEAKKFDKTKYDTYVRGVTAYSTLGWFEDPLLSTMLGGSDADLVNVVIHESAHATLFIKNQADFNERLATYLGNKGTELFYTRKEGEHSPTIAKLKLEDSDEKLFSEFISTEVKSLKEWYKAHPGEDRTARLKAVTERFAKEVKPKMKTDRYGKFEKVEINNAFLAAINTYVYDLSDFDQLYVAVKGDLAEFLKLCKSLEREKDPALKLKEFLRSSRP